MSTTPLPDDALVVRGGQNLPINFARGSGVAVGNDEKLKDVSVNCASEQTLQELTAPNPQTGYPGIPHNRVGMTTVSEIRAMGGEVVAAPTKTNSSHALLSGLTPDQASVLFLPTVKNPNR